VGHQNAVAIINSQTNVKLKFDNMKKLTFTVLALWVVLVQAQAQNPYAALGIEERVLHYDDMNKEMFDNDSIKPIGYALYSVKDGLLEIYDLKDSLVASQRIDPSNVARWLSVDPKAQKYPSWSPYNYTLGNPISFIDPDGREVKPANQEALNLIRMTLSQTEAAYVRFDANGYIDKQFLNQGAQELGKFGGNYTALMFMANHQEIVEFSVGGQFNYMTHGNVLASEKYNPSVSDALVMWEIDGGASDRSGKNAGGQTFQEALIGYKNLGIEDKIVPSGTVGVTLYPINYNYDAAYPYYSTNGNTQVSVSNTNPMEYQVPTAAHELFGHGYFKLRGLPHSHGQGRTPGSEGYNQALEEQIIRVQNEATQNYNSRKN